MATWKTCVSLLINGYDRCWARCTECCRGSLSPLSCSHAWGQRREEKRKDQMEDLSVAPTRQKGKRRAAQQFLWREGGDSSKMQWRESSFRPFMLSNDGSWAALRHCEKPCAPLASREQEQHCYFCHDSASRLTRNRASRSQMPIKWWLDKWVDPPEDSEQSQMDVCSHLREWIGECTSPVWWLFN